MLIAGLSGSVGMGKSTVAGFFEKNKIPVFSADKAVHSLYDGPAVPFIYEVFPSAIKDNQVDRAALSDILMRQPHLFSKLEEIIHPLVRDLEWFFIKDNYDHGARLIVLEIPLLFETGADQLMDVTMIVSAGEEQQRQRVLARPNMTEAKLNMILAQQMSDDEKRRNADFVIDTSCTLEETERATERLISRLKVMEAKGAFQRWQNLYKNRENQV